MLQQWVAQNDCWVPQTGVLTLTDECVVFFPTCAPGPSTEFLLQDILSVEEARAAVWTWLPGIAITSKVETLRLLVMNESLQSVTESIRRAVEQRKTELAARPNDK